MSHPTPDIWRPPWGEVHRRPETCFGREPFSSPARRSQPGKPDGACPDALHGNDDACAASCLTDLLGEVCISDEPASDAGTGGPESLLTCLLDQLHVTGEPVVDFESIGSTDLMLVDSDSVSLDTFPTNVVVYDEPLPPEESDGSAVMEVLVISHNGGSGGADQDPLQEAFHETPLRSLLA